MGCRRSDIARHCTERTVLVLLAMLLSACTEITTNDIIGTADAGWQINGEDTLRYDAAADMEGLWLGGWESEDAQVFFAQHAGAGSLNVWIPTLTDDGLDLVRTIAVFSELAGSGFLNVNPVIESGRDSLRYWPFRYISGEDQLRLHFLKEEFIISANEAEMISAIDTLESDRIEIDAHELSALLSDFDWEPWVVEEAMIWRRIGVLPE